LAEVKSRGEKEKRESRFTGTNSKLVLILTEKKERD
jgi:hypothetical protein